MKGIVCASLFVSAFVGCAQAADLAGATAAEFPPAAPSCWGGVREFLTSSIKDCPLSYAGFTLFGNVDGGFGYSQWGVPAGRSADKPNYGIQKNSANSHWLWAPNAISTSVVGIAMQEKLFDDWTLIGVAEAGFNPHSLMLVNGPRSMADNNLKAIGYQTSNFDSSRAGQWDNSQGFIGFSNPTYGTLTFGRTNVLSASALGKYDPLASVAFSQIGFSSIYSGFGVSSTTRINSALTYRLTYHHFHIAAQAQIGGYNQGNATNGQYQIQLGADFDNLSFDAVAGVARNAVALSSYSGDSLPPGYDTNSILKATLSNSGGFELMARYKWGAFKFYGGYVYARSENPSDAYANGLPTIARGIFVPPGAVTSNAFDVARVLNTVWTGVRYAALRNLDLSAGAYWETQNDYLPASSVCTGSGSATSSSKCGGGRFSYSFLLDYKPLNRIDLYAGVMVSNVYGGVASGYLHTRNIDPTVGVRFRF
jgi:predicted porin